MKKIFSILIPFLMCFSVASHADKMIVVDRNGTGNFRNIQQAIDSVRAFNPDGWVTIYIKNGFYKEKIEIPTHVCNIRLIGEDKNKTIISFDDHAKINNMGTFRTYTLKICGNDILVENLTVKNAAAPLAQAVALQVEGDRIVFLNCRFLGNQDTIYAGRENSHQYYENCWIEGTTDFIFGPATCWFENCQIYCKRNSYITAASTPQNVPFGFIFNHCTVSLADSVNAVYLGRPWRPYAMTVFMNCYIPKGIVPTGWHNWKNPENEKTARYFEFNNSGEGSKTDARVKWAKQLTKKESENFSVKTVLGNFVEEIKKMNNH